MTYKYYEVRREIYEKNPSSNINSYRSFSEMVRLFKFPYWIMLGFLVIALIGLAAITKVAPGSPFALLLMIIIMIVLVLSQIPREKYLYNESERESELSQKKQNYEKYVSMVWNIFRNHGIDTYDKVQKLKIECEKKLNMSEDKFAKINSKIVDMLIGVPLGALIASLIYADSKAVPMAIVTIIFGGLAILGVLKLIYLINYYSEGYFKDKYLLEAINELAYFELNRLNEDSIFGNEP